MCNEEGKTYLGNDFINSIIYYSSYGEAHIDHIIATYPMDDNTTFVLYDERVCYKLSDDETALFGSTSRTYPAGFHTNNTLVVFKFNGYPYVMTTNEYFIWFSD
jgi:hypothetical protein